MLGTLKYRHCVNEHEHCEHDEVKTGKRFRQSLVVTCQTPEAVKPAEAALDHPPPGQQYKALFRLRQFDHLQVDAFIKCRLLRLFARVSLIYKCHPDRISRHLLDLTREFCDLCTSCSLAGVTWTASNCPSVSTAICTLLPRLRL